MATLRQIEANRLNAQKSSGPRSVEGKAVSRMNALKTGIDAKSNVIPGEDPDALEALAAEYHERFRPSAPEQRFLVDSLVASEWMLRRLRKVEAQLWQSEMEEGLRRQRLNEKWPLGALFTRAMTDFNRLQRRIDSADRIYHRALEKLERLQVATAGPASPQPNSPPEPEPPAAGPVFLPPTQDEPSGNQQLGAEIGFVPQSVGLGFQPRCLPVSRSPMGIANRY
ncbi:MAG: hypothetical protein ABSC23_19375 [Bryobacteraceae bacterium]|jgi:hypothetical protein